MASGYGEGAWHHYQPTWRGRDNRGKLQRVGKAVWSREMKGDSSIDVATRAAGLNVLLQVSELSLSLSRSRSSCVGLSQVLLRVSTFVLNGVVLRYIQPHLLGVVNLRCLHYSPPHSAHTLTPSQTDATVRHCSVSLPRGSPQDRAQSHLLTH